MAFGEPASLTRSGEHGAREIGGFRPPSFCEHKVLCTTSNLKHQYLEAGSLLHTEVESCVLGVLFSNTMWIYVHMSQPMGEKGSGRLALKMCLTHSLPFLCMASAAGRCMRAPRRLCLEWEHHPSDMAVDVKIENNSWV